MGGHGEIIKASSIKELELKARTWARRMWKSEFERIRDWGVPKQRVSDINTNHWRTLYYHDPAHVLRRLRATKRELADALHDADKVRARRDRLRARARDRYAVSRWHGGNKANPLEFPARGARRSGLVIRCPLVTPCGSAASRPGVPLLCRTGRRRRGGGIMRSAPPRGWSC